MRQWTDIIDYRPMLVGTMGGLASGTICSDAIDVMGFHDMMGVITYACVGGTNAQDGGWTVYFQEGQLAAGTGGAFTQITDGEVMGSVKVSSCVMYAGTYPTLAATSFYEKLSTGRSRYLRAIVKQDIGVSAATAGCESVLTIGVILGRPCDTLWLAKPTVIATVSPQYIKPVL
jgi:hypothetical protein